MMAWMAFLFSAASSCAFVHAGASLPVLLLLVALAPAGAFVLSAIALTSLVCWVLLRWARIRISGNREQRTAAAGERSK